jgi:hypothetical protein
LRRHHQPGNDRDQPERVDSPSPVGEELGGSSAARARRHDESGNHEKQIDACGTNRRAAIERVMSDDGHCRDAAQHLDRT